MNISVNLAPEQIEGYVTQAILDSTLGDAIKAVIEDEIKKLDSWNSPLRAAIQKQILIIIANMLRDEYVDQIKEAVQKKMTDEVLDDISSKAWNALLSHYE
jgi:hypothetical protein